MLKKIISGAQTGADIGGLYAAKECGLQTGGTIPKGFKTLVGPKPEYAEMFGIVEHSSDKYPPRTFENAKNSQATLRFAIDFNSAGEICTLKAIRQYNKPYFDIHIEKNENGELVSKETPEEVAKWLLENKVETLNVAGNSEKTQKGMQSFVQSFVKEVIEEMRWIYLFGE